MGKKATPKDKAMLERILSNIPVAQVNHKRAKDYSGNTAPKDSKTMSALKKAMENRK